MSRVLAFVDTAELRPLSGLHAPEFVEEVSKEFKFHKYPQTLEEFDSQKGIEFRMGRLGKKAISKLVIWPNVLVIETRSNTSECKTMLSEILHWAVMKFDLTYTHDMITRYAFVSDISFTSDAPLLTFDPLYEKIAERIDTILSDIWQESIHYELFDLKLGHDPLTRKWGIAPFQITRRAEHKFSDNKYFSEAPLPTDEHIALLAEYEKGVIERSKR